MRIVSGWLLSVLLCAAASAVAQPKYAPDQGASWTYAIHFAEVPETGCCRIAIEALSKSTVLESDGVVSNWRTALVSYAPAEGRDLDPTQRELFFPQQRETEYAWSIAVTKLESVGANRQRQRMEFECDRYAIASFFPLGRTSLVRYPCVARSFPSTGNAQESPPTFTTLAYGGTEDVHTSAGTFRTHKIIMINGVKEDGEPQAYSAAVLIFFSDELGIPIRTEYAQRRRVWNAQGQTSGEVTTFVVREVVSFQR